MPGSGSVIGHFTARQVSMQGGFPGRNRIEDDAYDHPVVERLFALLAGDGDPDVKECRDCLEFCCQCAELALQEDPEAPCLALDLLLQGAWHDNATIRGIADAALGRLGEVDIWKERIAEDAVRTMVVLDDEFRQDAPVLDPLAGDPPLRQPPWRTLEIISGRLDVEGKGIVWDRLKDLTRDRPEILKECQRSIFLRLRSMPRMHSAPPQEPGPGHNVHPTMIEVSSLLCLEENRDDPDPRIPDDESLLLSESQELADDESREILRRRPSRWHSLCRNGLLRSPTGETIGNGKDR